MPTYIIFFNSFLAHFLLWEILTVTTLCGSDHCDSRGRLFEEVFDDLNLCILHDGSSTCCHPASGTKSMLDLSVADPSLFIDLTWTVVDDLHGSDHFPVLVQFSQAEKSPKYRKMGF